MTREEKLKKIRLLELNMEAAKNKPVWSKAKYIEKTADITLELLKELLLGENE